MSIDDRLVKTLFSPSTDSSRRFKSSAAFSDKYIE